MGESLSPSEFDDLLAEWTEFKGSFPTVAESPLTAKPKKYKFDVVTGEWVEVPDPPKSDKTALAPKPIESKKYHLKCPRQEGKERPLAPPVGPIEKVYQCSACDQLLNRQQVTTDKYALDYSEDEDDEGPFDCIICQEEKEKNS